MRKVKRSESWSKICRTHAKEYVRLINSASVEHDDIICIDWAFSNLALTHRPNIYKYRTATLIRRAIKRGEIKENPDCVKNYHDWIQEQIETYGFDPRYI